MIRDMVFFCLGCMSPVIKWQNRKTKQRGGCTMKSLPWYRKDKFGYPIETFKGKPVSSFIRIVCQNIRKIVG